MKKIKEINEKGKGFMKDFVSFALKGNVMDMAIGVIIGSAFAALITAFTDDFINPLINGIGGINVAGKLKIYGGQYINWGHFLTSVINFLIMAFVLYIMLQIVKELMKFAKKEEEKEVKVTKSNEEKLLEEIRDLLKNKK